MEGNQPLVLIETVGGNTIYNRNDNVLVRLGETPVGSSIYTFQKAGTLKRGQHVSFDKQYVELSLEQIADALSSMPEYAYAQSDVFITNEHGKLVPRFKHGLIQGLWQRANRGETEANELSFLVGMRSDELEDRILGNHGADFSQQEYRRMGRRIHEHLSHYVSDGLRKEDGSPIVVEETTRSWVKGETDGPLERNVFYALAGLNPDFEKWFQTLPDQESPWESYKLWVTVRQGLRRDLGTIKGGGSFLSSDSGDSGSPVRESGKPTSLTPFKEHVLREVYHEISAQHADLMVTKVRNFVATPNEIMERIEGREGKRKPLLYMGLCREKPEEIKDANLVDYSTLVNLLGILSESLTFGIYAYLGVPGVTAKVVETGKSAGVETITERKSGRAFMFYERGNTDMLRRGMPFTGSDIARELAERFVYAYYGTQGTRANIIQEGTLKAIRSLSAMIHKEALADEGNLDSQIGLERGTLASLISLAANCNAALPELYFDIKRKATEIEDNFVVAYSTRDMSGASRRQIRSKEFEFSKLVKELEARYGIGLPKGFLFTHLYKRTLGIPNAVRMATEHRLSAYEVFQDVKEAVEDTKTEALNAGAKPSDFMTRDEAVKLLSSVGLQQLINLIPNNDFFDQVAASKT